MTVSLIDCKECYKTKADTAYSAYREVMERNKKLIHIQVVKKDKTQISTDEAVACVNVLLSLINYLEKFYKDKSKPNINGFNSALDLWFKNQI